MSACLNNWTFLLVTWDYRCVSQFLFDYEAFRGQQGGWGRSLAPQWPYAAGLTSVHQVLFFSAFDLSSLTAVIP